MSSSRGSLIYRIWATIKQGAFHGDHKARRTVEETQYARQSSMKKSSQVSQLGASATNSKALDLGRGEPWEKAAHKLGLLSFPALSLKSTEVGEIDVKKESPVGHGRIAYFSIYCEPNGNFGDGKSRLWVDVLDGGEADVLKVFKPYFEDPCVKKVWHNYSFDKHILSRHGIHAQGFFRADTMFLALAQLNDLARRGAKGV